MASVAPPPDASRTDHRGFSFWWPVGLVFAVALCTSHSRTAEIPFSLLALLAPYFYWRQRSGFWDYPSARLLLALFACYWLPMVAALPDALNLQKSALQTVVALRFPLAGLTILAILKQAAQITWVYRLVAGLLVFWSGDALIQQALGYNLIGMPNLYPRLSGVFASDYLRLGLYCGVLLPFLLHQVQFHQQVRLSRDGQFEPRRSRAGRWLPGALWLLGVFTVLVAVWVSGTRSGWIGAGLSLTVWGVFGLRRYTARHSKRGALGWLDPRLIVLVMAAAVTVGLSYWYVPSVKQRVDQTALILSGDEAAANEALSYRLPIWRHAWDITTDHPVNGVGPRGFRYAYSARADSDDYFMQKEGMGASHAHQVQLSITTETGVIGLLGFVLGAYWFWQSWRDSPRVYRCLLAPPALCLFVAVFPLNSHLDAYASSPALLFWWLMAVYLAARGEAAVTSDGHKPEVS